MLSRAGGGPYIGIAGITSRSQVDEIVAGLPVCPLELADRGHPGRRLAIGVLVSDKTLAGVPVKKFKRHPEPGAIPDIWHPGVFNTLHYHSSDPDADLVAVADRCGLKPGYGMQLNIVWPNPDRVKALADTGVHPILQVSRGAIDECSADPARVVGRLGKYRGLKYALTDLSGGRGVSITRDDVRFALAIFRECAWFDLAVAGGLGPGAISQLDYLVNGHPHAGLMRYALSVDAESGLRDADDELVVERCLGFVGEALGVFCLDTRRGRPACVLGSDGEAFGVSVT